MFANLSFKNVRTWVLVVTAVLTSVAGIMEGKDVVLYRLIGFAENEEQNLIRHMLMHLTVMDTESGSVVGEEITFGDSKVRIDVFKSDQCILVKRLDLHGTTLQYKIIPRSDGYKDTSCFGGVFDCVSLASDENSFQFGVHSGDFLFVETFMKQKKGAKVIRTYSDECQLVYFIDDYGRTSRWVWVIYRHSP